MNKFIIPTIFLIVLISCSQTSHVVNKNATPEINAVNIEKARIVFMRPHSAMPGRGPVVIYNGDSAIGILSNKDYFMYDVKPGKHIFAALRQDHIDFLKANISAGKIYYVQCIPKEGFGQFHPQIIAVKKDSEEMSALDNVLPTLNHVKVNTGGVRRRFPTKSNVLYTELRYRSGLRYYGVGYEYSLDTWLKSAEGIQKPELLSEDGI